MRVIKSIFILLIIFSYILLAGCSINYRPIYLISTPQSTYGKNQVSISFSSDSTANFTSSLNLQINDSIISIRYVLDDSYNSTSNNLSYSFETFLGKNFWLKADDYEYPWGNAYVGIRPSLHYYESYTEKNTYIPIDLNFGFRPGIYRENYNLNLLLRGSVGITIPFGYYFSAGIGIQGNVFFGNVFGLGLNLEISPTVGGIQFSENYGALLVGSAPLVSVYLLFKF